MAEKPIMLEQEVQRALDCIKQKKNFILTGGAGSGKTYSLVQVINEVIKKYPAEKVFCMTYTNVAVKEIEERVNHKNLKVSTIHDFLWDNIKHFQKEIKVSLIALANDKDSNIKIENDDILIPDNYFDVYGGRYAAQMQKMNIYCDMYEGHDLKMVTGMDSDSLLFDPWPHAFLGTMEPDERRRFLDAYRDRNNEFHSRKRSFKEVAEWKYQRYLQDYMGVVASVDESVGEILNYLKRTGLDKNTIVVYTTDQGFYLGEHGWFDKRFMYEESFGMPMVMRWPGHIKPETQVTGLTQNIDFAPTFLDMCGIEVPRDMQGVSFRELVETGKKPRDWRKSLYYHYYEFPGFHSVRAHYGVKMERYKLMHFYVEDKWELYDLKTDPTEMHNLYGQKEYEPVVKEIGRAHV